MKIPTKFWRRNVQVVTDLAALRTETCVGSGGRQGAGLICTEPSKPSGVRDTGPSECDSGGGIEKKIDRRPI